MMGYCPRDTSTCPRRPIGRSALKPPRSRERGLQNIISDPNCQRGLYHESDLEDTDSDSYESNPSDSDSETDYGASDSDDRSTLDTTDEHDNDFCESVSDESEFSDDGVTDTSLESDGSDYIDSDNIDFSDSDPDDIETEYGYWSGRGHHADEGRLISQQSRYYPRRWY
ncbi:uncharacterized protein BDV17DRAFT_294224 [Aspergillus undulatus]|uniref:uncharacterized protein n=1 Tax=Aspergillus undulatus TaxID=1810928 RepID=UPI003CCCCCB9